MSPSSEKLLLAAGVLSATLAAQGAEPAKIAPGVYFRHGEVKRGQANGGYIVFDKFVAAVEAPNPEAAAEMLAEIPKITDKPLRYLIITHGHWDHDGGVDVFLKRGVTVLCHKDLLPKYRKKSKVGKIVGVTGRYTLESGERKVEIFSLGTAHSPTDLFVHLPAEGVLFTGDTLVTMPTMWLGDCDLDNWIRALGKLAALKPKTVCPGHGPAASADTLRRAKRYLTSLRDQVALQVCQGRSLETAQKQLVRPHREDHGRDYAVGVPLRKEYATDQAFADHVKAAYAQLTAEPPAAPADGKPRALVLLGDHYHPPDYIRPPLATALRAAGMAPVWVYDVKKLTARNLKGAKLLVVLRDGMNWPRPGGKPRWWMTAAQEKAIVAFVEAGGGLLALHNAMALKPWGDKQPPSAYVDLVGSAFGGHGATDEKFTVRVTDKAHPVTRGVSEYVAVDERHTPRMHARAAAILLTAAAGAKASPAAYVRTQKKGRVCYLAPGHNGKVLALPPVQRLIANASKWCAGIDK